MQELGIDLGSRYVKIVKFDGSNVEFEKHETVEFYKKFINRNENGTFIDIKKLNIDPNCKITATGYGRNLMSFSNAEVISEIKAHFRGALRQSNEDNFILVDIGGQDSKVILARDGYIHDFIMNDKCAASTGRFIENACNILGISIDDIIHMKDNPANLSSTCAVFCESELIGLIASGCHIDCIAAGINQSIAKRLLPLLKTYKSDKIFASGGVAKNISLLEFLSKSLNKEITPLANPQFNGALGCLSI